MRCFPVADKIIFDSSTVPGASAALSFLRSLRARGCRVADLHWTRLTGWREILAHLFDDQALPASTITTARVSYGGEAPSSCALYFAAWIARALPAAAVAGRGGRRSAGAALGHARQRHLELTLTITAPRSRCRGCGRHYRSLLPPVDEESLMREELNILGPDLVYDRVLG